MAEFDNLQFTPEDIRDFTPRRILRESRAGRRYLMESGREAHYNARSDIRPFVAWDGEGITPRLQLEQNYVLFGASTGDRVKGPRLTTRECLDLILSVESQYPTAIHVGFAFKYDVEMILADLPRRHWERLRAKGNVRFQEYRLTYHPGKRFTVSRGRDSYRVTATIYDLFGFFQTSFVKALRTWLDEKELAEIAGIEAGKSERGNFDYARLDTLMVPYWESELRLLVLLAERLRERLIQAGICPAQWHGPGAVATTVYRQRATRGLMARTETDKLLSEHDAVLADLPEDVNNAARYAYAGGRFELFRLGHYDGSVYQYDINSAYPAGISTLPNLAIGEWSRHSNSVTFDPRAFALWRIEYDNFAPLRSLQPHPLFHRDRNHNISYPMTVSGWYWTPEAACALTMGGRIAEAWIYNHDGSEPFHWVKEMYAQRKQWKAEGNPAERALKLALNSLYGKMAQRAGWEDGKPLPRYHQLEWAGYVTSFTRATLWQAIQQAGSDLIAVETDAVFTTKPLTLPIGGNLGEWEATEYDWITYLASGLYWTSDGKSKYRGMDSSSLSHADALRWINQGDLRTPIRGHTSRFIGAGKGLRSGLPIWRSWVTEMYDIRPGRSGKRIHVPHLCAGCKGDEPMHRLAIPVRGGKSLPHSLPWRGTDKGNVEGNPWWDIEKEERWDGTEC